jgi:hypothetical protein
MTTDRGFSINIIRIISKVHNQYADVNGSVQVGCICMRITVQYSQFSRLKPLQKAYSLSAPEACSENAHACTVVLYNGCTAVLSYITASVHIIGKLS